MQNIVTWGQNMSANIEEFACFSMGGLFSGVPPSKSIEKEWPSVRICHFSVKRGNIFI